MTLATDITALEAALAKGIRRVTDENGRTVEYQSAADIAAALARLKARSRMETTGRGFAITKLKAPSAK